MAGAELPELRGERVLLRRPCPADVEARLRLGRDPEIMRMYGGSAGGPPMTRDGAERWVQSLSNHGHAWVIEASGALIGSIRLDRIDLQDRRASLAIGIEDKMKLGAGLGTEAIMLVLHHAFATLALHRIAVRVVAYNTRAIRAYEKCGFLVEGREREAAFVDGTWHDDVIMGILDSEFRARHTAGPDR